MTCRRIFCPGQNHVANNYNQDIFVRVDADRSRISRIELSLKNQIDAMGISVDTEMTNIADRNGYTAVQSKKFLLFQPGHSGTKYVSIFDTSGKLIAGCFPIGCNDSVMVKTNGYIALTRMGHIWEPR